MNKTCSKCGILKSTNEFSKNKSKKGGFEHYCKECFNSIDRSEYYKKYYDKTGREKAGQISMYENKSCAQYLGVVIAERLVKHLFKNVEIMPMHNPGFDFICNKGKKIDVKSGCLSRTEHPYWQFNINHNIIADHFICVAFDNRTDLNPLHMWMIPGYEVNNQGSVSIRSSRIHKWNKWKRDINNAQICCNEMKGV